MKLNTPLKILIPSIISQEDIKVLTLFYQPLLGSGAYTLYLTFYELSNLNSGVSDMYLHQDILDLLNVKLEEFLRNRNKLEALGLIVVHESKKDTVYSLKTPLTAKEFLNDTILGMFLQDQIGEEQVKRLIKLFRLETLDLTKYDNITKSFNEVYEVESTDIVNFGNHLRGPSYNGGTKVVYEAFDYQKFIESIPVRYQKAHLFNAIVRDNIEKMAFVYQFTNKDIKTIYMNSSQSGEMPTVERLRLQAKLYYQQKEQKDAPEISEKHDDLTKHLDTISPIEIIKLYSKSSNLASDIDTALAFTSRTDVPLGILNVIILHTIKAKEGLLPNVKYLEKVLNTWQQNGVTSTQEALNYAQQIEGENTFRTTRSSKPKVVEEPEWLDDFIKDFMRR